MGGVPGLGQPMGAVGELDGEETSFLDWMFIGTVGAIIVYTD